LGERERERERENRIKGESLEMSGVCEETTVDWRGRPSNPSKHGGMKAATFVLGKCSIADLHLSFSFLFIRITKIK
jgi:hypothetical protein